MKKIKIGIDIRAIGCQRTGDETYTLNLVRALLEIDKENFYYLLTNTRDKKELSGIKKKITGSDSLPGNARIISVSPSYKLLWTFLLLPYKAFKLNLDILHVQYIAPLFLPGKTKIVTTIHDISFVRYPQHIGKKDLLFLKTLIPLSIRRAFKVIAVSDFTRREIEDYYKKAAGKVVAVENGGAAEGFIQKAVNFTSKKEKTTSPYIFYIGTHQPRKNIPVLIRSFAELKKKHRDNDYIKNLKLIIGGKRNGRNYDNKIEEALEEVEKGISKDIVFPGYISQDELPAYYKGADCFVFPSLYEGFGLPLLEAMSAGTPVVCSDIPCFREVAGEAALFFDPNKGGDLPEKMFQVIIDQELKNKLIQKGKKRVKKFTWSKCAEETRDVYLSATGKG
ncbi:MAG: glycosyltransferase family 1 protein [Candidatus Moraniibacteriota bacterium]